MSTGKGWCSPAPRNSHNMTRSPALRDHHPQLGVHWWFRWLYPGLQSHLPVVQDFQLVGRDFLQPCPLLEAGRERVNVKAKRGVKSKADLYRLVIC